MISKQTEAEIVRLVLRHAIVTTLVGIGAGTALAAASDRSTNSWMAVRASTTLPTTELGSERSLSILSR